MCDLIAKTTHIDCTTHTHTHSHADILKVNGENRHWFGDIFSQTLFSTVCVSQSESPLCGSSACWLARRVHHNGLLFTFFLKSPSPGTTLAPISCRWCALILIWCVLNKYSNYTPSGCNAIGWAHSTAQHACIHLLHFRCTCAQSIWRPEIFAFLRIGRILIRKLILLLSFFFIWIQSRARKSAPKAFTDVLSEW